MKMRNLLFVFFLGLLAVVHSTPITAVTQITTAPYDNSVQEITDYGSTPSLPNESLESKTTISAPQHSSTYSEIEGSANGKIIDDQPMASVSEAPSSAPSVSNAQNSTSTSNTDESNSDSHTTQSSVFTSSVSPSYESGTGDDQDHVTTASSIVSSGSSTETRTASPTPTADPSTTNPIFPDSEGSGVTSDCTQTENERSGETIPASSIFSVYPSIPDMFRGSDESGQTIPPSPTPTADPSTTNPIFPESEGSGVTSDCTQTESDGSEEISPASSLSSVYLSILDDMFTVSDESGQTIPPSPTPTADPSTADSMFPGIEGSGVTSDCTHTESDGSEQISPASSVSTDDTPIPDNTVGGSEESGQTIPPSPTPTADPSTAKPTFPGIEGSGLTFDGTLTENERSGETIPTSSISTAHPTNAMLAETEGYGSESGSDSESGSGFGSSSGTPDEILIKATVEQEIMQSRHGLLLHKVESPDPIPNSQKGQSTPGWIIIVGFIAGVAALVMLCVAIATRDKWNRPNQASHRETKTSSSNQQRELEMETFLHNANPRENGKAGEYTVIPLDELPDNYSLH